MPDEHDAIDLRSVDLEGQVSIVTGATAGLGRRFARVLAAAGADVVVVGRRAGRAAEVCRQIEQDGGRAHPVVMDVSTAGQVAALFDQAEQRFGLVTTLVNNAGISDAQFATKMSLELIDDVISTNLRAPFVLACEAARRLIAAKRSGRIVNISSMAAHHYDGTLPSSLYATTKAAVDRMTEVLAVEWAKFGINVNAIAPGVFASEMVDGMVARVGDLSGGFPRRRMGQPEQLDSTLLYLVSPASAAVTGTIVKVDDGQLPR